ncbi:MAG TPA: TIGR00296 family protein [Thermoplasmata archaeon]|nr:TIGR00296 family protein [Thermoplasmata archaeon]
MLGEPEGTTAVRRARAAIAAAVGAPGPAGPVEPTPAVFREPRGVFVTILRHPSGALRGCIGYPLPVLPLGDAVERAAVAAAIDDPRFRPVRAEELDRLVLDVSILTVPEPIAENDPARRVAAVEVGRHGLIVEGRGTSGLLLPQVAVEQRWSAEEFLDGTCEKAGLPPGAWRLPGVRLERFEATIFRETAPNGPVVREELPATPARRAPRS